MSEPLISRVYDLKVAGYDDAKLKVDALTTAFNKMDAAKKKLNEALQKKLDAGDTKSIEALQKQIKDLQVAMEDLSKKREASAKELELLSKAEKNEADAKLKLAKADRERQAAMIDQDKELDRQIALEEKKAKQDAKNSQAAKAQADNYYALMQAQRAALELYRITPQESPMFEQVKKGAIDAKAKVDAFNRSLSPDGTLVGEYKTGILNAFKQLGLGDFLKEQKNDIEKNLQSLIQKNQTLAAEYRKTSQQGGDAFNKIDAELKESIKLQQQMEANLLAINTAFKGTGGIGKEITSSLTNEFKNLKTNIAQVAVGYVGFQAILGGVQSIIGNNLDFETKTNELQAITGIVGKGLETLKQKALETSSSTKFSTAEILESYKMIASAKPELVDSAESLDKVNQAGVRLAQASGSQLPEAISGLLDVLNQYGAGADEASSYVDALAAGSKYGAAEIPAISTALKEFGTQAKASNVSIFESVGLIELLASKGIQGAEAGTKLRNVLLALNAVKALDRRAIDELTAAGVDMDKLSNTTISLEERLAELGKIANNNTALVKVFGKENFNAAQIVLQNIPAYANFANQVKEVGVAQTQASINSETAAVKFAKLGNQIKNALTSETVLTFLSVLATSLSVILNLPFGILIGALTTVIALTDTWAGAKTRLVLAYTLETAAMVVEYGQLLINNAVKATANLITAAYTAATIRSAVASGTAATAYRVLAASIELMTSPFLLVTGLIVGFVTVIGIMSSRANTAKGELAGMAKAQAELAAQQKISTELSKEALKATSDQRAQAALLVSVVKDLSLSEETRNANLKKLLELDPAFQKALVDGKVNYQELDKALTTYNASLLRNAELEAAKGRQQKEFGKLTDLVSVRQELEVFSKTKRTSDDAKALSDAAREYLKNAYGADYVNMALKNVSKEIADQTRQVDAAQAVFAQRQGAIDKANQTSTTNAAASTVVPMSVFDRFKKLVREGGRESDFKDLKTDIDKQKSTLNVLSKDYKDLVILEKQLDEFLNPKDKGTYRGSRLTGEQKDAFKDIDAKRDELLANEKLKFAQLQTTEDQYLQNILSINKAAADQKLAIIKGKNAEERKQIAELNLYKIEQDQETNKKLFDIQKSRLERNLDDAKKMAENEFNAVNDDPTKKELEKLQAREKYISQTLALQVTANDAMNALEARYGVKSEENEKKRRDAIYAINKELQKVQLQIVRETYEEQLRLINETTQRQQNEIKQITVLRTTQVLNDNTLGDKSKALKLKQIENDQTKVLLAQDVANAKLALEEKEKALQKNLATEVEVSDAKTKLKLAELALLKHVSDTEKSVIDQLTSGLKDAWNNLTNFFKGVKATNDEIKDTIGAAQSIISDTINQAKQAYFDNQRQQIENEKQVALDRLALQQQQLEDVAQSEDEKESIRRQFDEKRKQAEKQAGEEKKQVALKELALNFAVAVVKTLAAYPFPFSLIPVAALTGQYLLQRSIVSAQQFAEGGMVRPMNVGNGRITANSNIPRQPNGDNVFATVKTNEVILNEDQQRRAGGPAFFKALGVPGFAGGGYTGGSSLQAPSNPGEYLSPQSFDSNYKKVWEAIDKQTKNIDEFGQHVNTRIDKLKVEVSAGEVEETNNRTKKARSIGTL